MDISERPTLEPPPRQLGLISARRHRYEFAALLCAEMRVLELWCGDGQGTTILGRQAREVLGIDDDAASVDLAQATVGRDAPNVGFEIAEPLGFLSAGTGERFEVVVCLQGMERSGVRARALERLLDLSRRGVRIVISLPNGEQDTGPRPGDGGIGYEEAVDALAAFPEVVMVPQFLAEGSLITPAGATDSDVVLELDDRLEPEYANDFIFLAGFDQQRIARAHHGRVQARAAPVFNRSAANLEAELRALRSENARLARERLGKGGSAAATVVARYEHHEQELAQWKERCRAAEQRVGELGATLAASAAPAADGSGPRPLALERAPIEAVEARSVAIAPGEDPNSWEMRRRRAAEVLIPWIEQTVPLAGKTVLEYGCGNAAVSCAFAERAGKVIGLDIDRDWIELGERELRKRGLQNVELELHPPDTIRDAVAARRGQVDVFLLYAVLEHLTIDERLAVLRLAREVVKPDGRIVVCEAPNRLIYFDHHTAQMPFFHLLPAELALHYHGRSGRSEFKQALDEAVAAGQEAAVETLIRWGRGVSFHEFEVVFGDLSRHVIASNYDPLLFGERPVHPDEVILWRYLERWRPDLAPVWSRYWLDLILSPQPFDQRPTFLRPWTADTDQSRNVGYRASEGLHLKGPQSTLWVTLPKPTRRMVLGSGTHNGYWLVLHVRPEGTDAPLVAGHKAAAGITAFSSFALPAPASRIAIECSGDCEIVFVGYED